MAHILEFTDCSGNVLASQPVPNSFLEEGQHGETRDLAVKATVTRGGRLARYQVGSLSGPVTVGPRAPGVFVLDRLDVNRGEYVEGTLTATTVKDQRQ